MPSTKTPRPLETYVARQIVPGGRFPTRGALAKALGMAESSFSQAVHGDIAFTPERAIRLAMVLHTSVPGVLRLAGHDDWAQLFEQHFSRSDKPQPLAADEREVIDLWRRSNMTTRDLALALLLIADTGGADSIRTSASARTRAKRLARDARALGRARRRESAGRPKRRAG